MIIIMIMIRPKEAAGVRAAAVKVIAFYFQSLGVGWHPCLKEIFWIPFN